MTQRLFVGLELPDSVKEDISTVQQTLQSKYLFSGSYTKKENLHQTLKFLGECDEKWLEPIKEQLDTISFVPFTIHLGKAGNFTEEEHIRVIWIELRGADELQKTVDNTLSGLFAKETRFMGHITLARPKRIFDEEKLKKEITLLKVPALEMKVTSISLIESKRGADGQQMYTTLHRVCAKEK